jgi:hypothetical protein
LCGSNCYNQHGIAHAGISPHTPRGFTVSGQSAQPVIRRGLRCGEPFCAACVDSGSRGCNCARLLAELPTVSCASTIMVLRSPGGSGLRQLTNVYNVRCSRRLSRIFSRCDSLFCYLWVGHTHNPMVGHTSVAVGRLFVRHCR